MADQVPAPIDPKAAASIGFLRQVLLGLGVLLAGHGVIGPNNTITPENWQFGVGLFMALIPVAWSAWEKFAVAKNSQEREAIAVNATINLLARGAMLATDGSLIPAPPVPPLPATPATAQDIVTVYAPKPIVLGQASPSGTSTDDLNAMANPSLRKLV